MSLFATIKGWFGEAQGALAQVLFLDGKTYTSINNITISTKNGSTQIDHVVVSRFGIFVIEAKNMKGWIFGDESSKQWTQNLFGKKHKFQNPLHQNYRHIKALQEFLGVEDDKLHSLVMFWGDSEFKTPMPENVLDRGYSGHIKSKTRVVFSDEEVQDIVTAIKENMLPKTWATRKMHVQSLKDRFAEKTNCPKCRSLLVLRTAKSGKNAGNQFYGCSNFPACRYVVNSID